MTFKKKILITMAVVVGFDVVASLASRLLKFDYANLMLVSLAIYFGAGYWGAHKRGFLFGLLLCTLAGLTDSTIGWWVSTLIRPYSRIGIPALDLSVQFIILIIVTPLAFGIGFVGAGICRILGQTKSA